MSAISGVSQIANMNQLLALLVTQNPSMNAATHEAMAALDENLASMQTSEAAMADGTTLDVIA